MSLHEQQPQHTPETQDPLATMQSAQAELTRAREKVTQAEEGLDIPALESMMHEHVGECAEMIVKLLSEKQEEWNNLWFNEQPPAMRKVLEPLLISIHPELTEALLDILGKEIPNNFLSSCILAQIVSIATERHRHTQETEHAESGSMADLQIEDLEITMQGEGRDYAGFYMSGGTLIVEGGAGKWAGDSMSGGKLDLHGAVESFDSSAFSPTNKGTITWKGVTLWKDGNPTPEYGDMMANGKIPIK